MDETKTDAASPEEEPLDLPYELYILTLTIISIVVAVLSYLYMPIDEQMSRLFWLLDTIVCVLFLIDFARQLARADEKGGYMRHGGLADLLGSIPAIPALRFFRLFRVVRIVTRLRRLTSGEMGRQLIAQRAQFTLLFAGLAALVLISGIGITVYLVEHGRPDANITTPGDALWWGITTSSTVGYGDRFPVTTVGRILAAVLMIAGVALIGVVSSYLATSFISPTKGEQADQRAREAGDRAEISALRTEVREIRALLEGGATLRRGQVDTP
ncbi:MAG TPA: ion transporter [Actinomycetota bacterium]|nr:ion transporter [Actinomycetota bacterium]